MCGFFGIMWHQSSLVPDAKRLRETIDLLKHRGPDSRGQYVGAGIGLVHTRLSLLDPTPRSDQPFWDKQNRYCIIYNGEIYNFKGLRSELERAGRSFRTTSDTEVLLECIIHYGPETTLRKIEGMFAFAVYDKQDETLLLARDRFGIKPLYIYDMEDMFVFASEIRAMRPWIKLEPDFLTISAYLQGYAEPTYRRSTYYRNIKFLAPGSVIKIRKGSSAHYTDFFNLSNFWDHDRIEQLNQKDEKDIIDGVEALLLNSIKTQLHADVPVGALCSGGVDSSLITAMASSIHNNIAIFHANIVGIHSEHDAATSLSKSLKLDLHHVDVYDDDFINQFVDVIDHYDHPFLANPHSIPFLMVSRLVQANKVKAVLTGEGADECFLGYEWLAPDIRDWRRIVTKKLKKGYHALQKYLPNRAQNILEPGVDTNILVPQLHNRFENTMRHLDISAKLYTTQAGMKYRKELKTLGELGCTLPSLLHRNDSLGMAAGIEARFPFLDHALVQQAVNIPYRYKVRPSLTVADSAHYFFENKWVLRKVAERYLPRSLSHRKKIPFIVDAFDRMTIAPLFFHKSLIADLFGLSTREVIYLSENADHEFRLQLVHLEVWLHVCLHNLAKQPIVDRLHNHTKIK